MPPALEIHTFGRFRIIVDGAEVEEQSWTRKKSKVLLKLLAIAPRREAHREQLIESLWPETSPEAGLNNLHKLIHGLRRTLEPNLRQGAASRFVLTQDQVVALAPAPVVWIDLEEFEALAAEGLQSGRTEPLEAALVLSQGDLLQEDMYDDWASLRREQARLLSLKVMDRLALAWEASDPRKATELLQRLVAANPLNEDAQRRLMRLYGAMGQRHLGLEQYRALSETLRAELGASPEPATVEAYERLLAGSAPALPKTEASLALPAVRPRRMVPPLIIAAVALLAAGIWWLTTRKTDAVPRPASLAIVPLRGGAGPDMEVIAEGVTEGLINSASRLPGIRVMARATMFTFKGRSDALAIGRELKVTSVLSGRIVRQSNGWTLAIELIDTTDGARLWGRQFFATPEELDRLQESAGSELASILQGTPRGADPPRAARPTRDPEAYQLYLKGQYFSNERTPASLQRSLEYFQQSLAKDPTYAPAWAGMADSYGLLAFSNAPPLEKFTKAKEAAQKALSLDDSLAEAHTSLAMVKVLYDWDWPGAETEFRRAITLNSGYATAHHWYGVNLAAFGRLGEAKLELARALDLDPLSPIINVNSGYPFYFERNYQEALTRYAKALELKPDFVVGHEDRLLLMEQMGNQAEAAREAVYCVNAYGTPDLARMLRGEYDHAGYPALLRRWLMEGEKMAATTYVSPMLLASLSVRIGDKARALSWLERANEQRSPPLIYIGADPQYDALRGEPRFRSLLQRAGLPVINKLRN